MKRILIANDLLKGGGVENVLENLVRYLLKQGNEVTLMIPNCSEKEIQDVFGENIKVYPAMRSLEKIEKYSFKWFLDRGLYVFQKQIYCIKFFMKQYDVVIALKEGPTMKEIAGLYGKKKFAWIHVDYDFLHWTKGVFKSAERERKCMMKFDKVICVSETAANSVIHQIGDPGNLEVRLNPVNAEKIIGKSMQDMVGLQEYLNNRKKNIPILVSVGRLCEQKGYLRLLNICAKLKDLFNFELWIVGDGPDREQLVRIINENNLSNVILWGNQNNPYPFIKNADWFVSSAICESYGLAMQEALILGIPVLAATCPVFEECISEGEAILVPNDEEGLYVGLYRILQEDNLRNTYINKSNQVRTQEVMFEQRLKRISELWEK